MASLINTNNIDITYPIAGQDNDTQGFRDNFRHIRNNLIVAKTEISDIQANLTSTVSSVSIPAHASSAGTAGQMAFDSSYLYVCIATDTWVRTSLSTW